MARPTTRREAQKRIVEARSTPDTHYMVQPHDGRLFLISNLPPARLARRYGFWPGGVPDYLFGSLGRFGSAAGLTLGLGHQKTRKERN